MSSDEEEGEVEPKMEAAAGKRGKGERSCDRVLCIMYAYRVNQVWPGVTSWYKL